LKSSDLVESIYDELRSEIPFHASDVYQSERMRKAASMV